MQEPSGYKEAQAGYQQREEINLGGHHMIIKQVHETMTKGAQPRPMVVVMFDFAENDAQKGMFMKEFKEDSRSDKKWPHRATNYIMTQDWSDPSKTNRDFKAFCTCFEKSNGVSMKWTEDPAMWAAQFKNKRIGGVFGLIHEEYNGREIVKTELRWFCEDAKADSAQIPNEKPLTDKMKATLSSESSAGGPAPMPEPLPDEGFINIPEDIDEEIPFR